MALGASRVPASERRIGRGVVDKLEQSGGHHAGIVDVQILGRLPEDLRRVAEKAERTVHGHDGADQVRRLGG
jgi:hypothetical protein